MPAISQAQRVMTYRVVGAGNTTDVAAFAQRAAEVLGNPRGWSLGGSLQFVQVPGGGDFVLWLAAPERLPGFSSGCSAQWSCRVGANVIINEMRWTGGTDAWNATGASPADYQAMVLNHEVGHRLGFGHSGCRVPGAPAPVMQQQSKDLQGCEPNPWPTAAERDEAGLRFGVPVLPLPIACPAAEPGQAPPGPGTPTAAATLLDTGSGTGTANQAPCRIKPGTTAGVLVGTGEEGSTTVHLIRLDRLVMDSPGHLRLWTSAGESLTVTSDTPLPLEHGFRVGEDGLIHIEAESRFGWAELAISGLGRMRSTGAGGTILVHDMLVSASAMSSGAARLYPRADPGAATPAGPRGGRAPETCAWRPPTVSPGREPAGGVFGGAGLPAQDRGRQQEEPIGVGESATARATIPQPAPC